MAFNGKYEYDPNGIDQIISEKGDYFLAFREVRWSSNKEFKNDLRHYRSTEEGDIPLKGCALTDDEADEFAKILIEEGFGDNSTLVEAITSYRPDLCKELKAELDTDADIPDVDARVRLFEKRERADEIETEDEPLDNYYDPRRDLFEESA